MSRVNYYAIFDFLERINSNNIDIDEFRNVVVEYAKGNSPEDVNQQEFAISQLKTASNELVAIINDLFMSRESFLNYAEKDDEEFLLVPEIVKKGTRIREQYGEKMFFNKTQTCKILNISRPTLNEYLKIEKYGLKLAGNKLKLKSILKAYGYINGLIKNNGRN